MSATQLGVTSQWAVFLFGAVFSFLTSPTEESLLYYAVKTFIGGAIWLAFQIVTNRIAKGQQKNKNEQTP